MACIGRSGRRKGQDGKVEVLKLISFYEDTKITTNCQTTTDEKDWDLPNMLSDIQRQKRSHGEMVGGVLSQYNQIS